jgi:hypothetical protein
MRYRILLRFYLVSISYPTVRAQVRMVHVRYGKIHEQNRTTAEPQLELCRVKESIRLKHSHIDN